MLLTLDTGGTIGWTLGPRSADAAPAQIAFGSFKLAETTDLGAYLASSDPFFQDMFGRGITAWSIEIPNTRAAKSAAAAAKMMGLYAHALYWASLMQVKPPTVFSPNEIKLALTGNGNAKKGKENPEMETAARALGFDVQNDHEADAVAIRRAYTHGVPESKSERTKRESAERKAAKAAAAPPKLL